MQRNRGFTLLEVLVAFVLLTTVGIALFQLYQGGLRNLSRSEEFTHAALLARSKLTELRAVRTLSTGIFEGAFETGYRWRLELTPYAEEAPHRETRPTQTEPLQLFSAELFIEWGGAEDVEQYRLQTLLLAHEAKPS